MTKISLSFVTILALYVTISPVYVLSQLTGTVSGKVIDEYGQGMKNVEIKAYSSDGAFIKSISTSSDGSFTIELPIGESNVLYFSKEGYVKVTKSTFLKWYTQSVDLGEIVLLKTVRLTSSILSIVASPGDKLQLPFAVSNVGEGSEIVEFLMFNPKGWSTRVLDQVGREITKVELSSSTSLNFQLEVTIPFTPTVDNNLTLTTVGSTNSTVSFVIKVQPSSKTIIACQFPGKSATPGDTVRFQLRLENPSGVEMSFKISLDSVPPNWTASVRSVSGDYVTEATLGSNEFVDLVVVVRSPDDAEIGEEYGLLVKVESNDGSMVDSLPLDIALNKVEEEVKITLNVKFPDVTVEAGKVVQYPITIVNSGTYNTTYLLSVDPPVDWKAVFKYGALEVSRLYLEAGRSENLVIEVTPPSTVNLGTYTIPVQVKSEDGAIYAETRLKAKIVGSYALKLEPSTLLTSVTTGGSTPFTAKITNTGYTTVTTIKVGVDAPTDWDVTITPVSVQSLKPSESYTFNVAVNTPSDTVAGDYMITLMGLSDQLNSDQVQVRVTATVPTSWGLIGVGIAAVMVIALIFAFMKFRRR